MPYKDPEQKRAYDRKRQEYHREYYLKNRESILQQRREANHPRDPVQRAAYSRRWRAANPEKVRLANKLKTDQNRKYIQSIKDVPCLDCSIKYPSYVMQFDHVRGEKLFNISRALPMTRKIIDEEIAKCEIVCANCHMERTYGTRKKTLDNRSKDV